jgi:cyclohexyl-isocyanide hydratase
MTGADEQMHRSVPKGPPQQIVMLTYPYHVAQDLVGPYTYFAALGNVEVHLVWKDKKPVPTEPGVLSLNPNATLVECPRDLDVLFVPGGTKGTLAVMRDPEVLEFLADRGSRARYVTSVCTGSLALGAAGLLKGYRATSHWAYRDLLSLFGATPAAERVVVDRNRITGGGVTSGIDFGLTLAAKMRDVRYAEMLQLVNEYDPQPPFHDGSPQTAAPEIVDHVRRVSAPGVQAFRSVALASRKRLGLT